MKCFVKKQIKYILLKTSFKNTKVELLLVKNAQVNKYVCIFFDK